MVHNCAVCELRTGFHVDPRGAMSLELSWRASHGSRPTSAILVPQPRSPGIQLSSVPPRTLYARRLRLPARTAVVLVTRSFACCWHWQRLSTSAASDKHSKKARASENKRMSLDSFHEESCEVFWVPSFGPQIVPVPPLCLALQPSPWTSRQSPLRSSAHLTWIGSHAQHPSTNLRLDALQASVYARIFRPDRPPEDEQLAVGQGGRVCRLETEQQCIGESNEDDTRWI
uniref:Uncharacterized protein n=1 Tax=Mycena chlorophos TaxID=658473 RepID=A0ABQ0M0L6_MYCCL|nr:predicted protein [Mycena chlorophos]